MSYFSVKKVAQVLVAMVAAAVMAALLCAPKAAGTSIGEFSVEQIYVNVPEMDVFVKATDAEGNAINPTLVKAAGVELYLGDEKVPTGNIAMANEPICYILAVDNSVSESTLKQYRIALRALINAKGEKDQIMLYTLAGDGDSTSANCVLPATIDPWQAIDAVNAMTSQEENSPNLVQAATAIYNDINDNYQSIAPRKVIFALSGAGNTAVSAALMGIVASDTTSRLNMPLNVFLTVDDKNPLADMGQDLKRRNINMVRESELRDAVQEKQQELANVLEIKTAINEKFYGEKLEILTLQVPQLGSAIKTTGTVYMGHRLAKPEVKTVAVSKRNTIVITFNQTVGRAEDIDCYRIESEDIWSWRVKIRQAVAGADGKTVTLYTDPLYQGTYTVKLINMPSAMTTANVSDSGLVHRFTVKGWPKDKAFYAARFRWPAAILGGLLAVLAVAALLRGRKEREEEKLAEAEHLLSDAAPEQRSLPGRWITLYLSTRRGIAETRWSAYVESSLIIGNDAAQCDLCLNDSRVRHQHAIMEIGSNGVTLRPLDGAPVMVNGDPIGGEYRLQNDDAIKIGRTTLRLVL